MGYSREWLSKVENGRGAPPGPEALTVLCTALNLSRWECRYLNVLAGTPAPPDIDTDVPMSDYLDGLLPHPAVWMDNAWNVREANSEFTRIFRGLYLTPNIVQWHYGSPAAKAVIRNWDETSQWCVGWLRFSSALNPDDQSLDQLIDNMLVVGPFREQWEQQVIPVDPETRPWVVHDTDRDVDVTLEMRAWRHADRAGILLLGVAR